MRKKDTTPNLHTNSYISSISPPLLTLRLGDLWFRRKAVEIQLDSSPICKWVLTPLVFTCDIIKTKALIREIPLATQTTLQWTSIPSSRDYIITRVILASSWVLAYDLLEDRCTFDVIITKFFPLCFKITESFENLDNILHDWANDKYKKTIVEALNWYEKHSLAGKRKIKPFLS